MTTTLPAGRRALRHRTGAARPGPPPDRPPSPAPPPPPPWRNWLLILGLLLTELLLERETVDGTDVDDVLGRIPIGAALR